MRSYVFYYLKYIVLNQNEFIYKIEYQNLVKLIIKNSLNRKKMSTPNLNVFRDMRNLQRRTSILPKHQDIITSAK